MGANTRDAPALTGLLLLRRRRRLPVTDLLTESKPNDAAPQVFGDLFFSEATGGGATATPTGVSSAASIGAAAGRGKATGAATGVSGAASIGTATATGGATAVSVGVVSVADVGFAICFGAGLAQPLGVESVAYVGTVTASGSTTSPWQVKPVKVYLSGAWTAMGAKVYMGEL